jgi:mono/diheme cytochrome c family protein
MRVKPSPRCRALSAALAVLYLALTLGAGAHRGPHVDDFVADLPADLHHHAYGLSAGPPSAPAPMDECVACHFSRLDLRLPAPGPPSLILPDTGTGTADPVFARPGGATYAAADPRAPPIA